MIIGILTIVSTYIARLTLYAAVWRIGSGQVALLWPVQMFLAVLFSVFLLQEQLSPIQWLGGGLTLADGDVMVIELPGFGRALRNPLHIETGTETPIRVEAL